MSTGTPRRNRAETAEKPRGEFKLVWPMIRGLVAPRRWMLALGLLLMAINRVTGLVLPGSSKFLLDDVLGVRVGS
ncbi:MAG TPA: hypothetical protein VLV15_15395, partial [Dongiaceae bacterium]|nr:hypothetical protein [Dongiaceae bacterium]